MPESQPPETGTLIISALLLLAIGFAGYWISAYAGSSGKPWDVARWFVGAALAVVVVGLITYLRRGRS